ncbi:hypothetical protein D1BOALGB6SA_161, partial [Olavius sp. associated proteobacterium Delta 1]
FEGVAAGRILGKMEAAGSRVNIIILDACRDNPYYLILIFLMIILSFELKRIAV